MSKEIEVICPYCGKEADWLPNEVVYGKRYGKSYMCYYCADCDAYVGTHQNSRQPLGTMANKELRKKRMEAHAIIDPYGNQESEPDRKYMPCYEMLLARKFI